MARRSPSVRPRNQRGPRERNARSQAVRRVAEQSLLRGSLVEMSRVCGKKNCRCQQGQKHRALYLAVRRNNRRAMIYIPPVLEDTVRSWIETGQEVEGLLDVISQECLQTLLNKKEDVLTHKRREKPP